MVVAAREAGGVRSELQEVRVVCVGKRLNEVKAVSSGFWTYWLVTSSAPARW